MTNAYEFKGMDRFVGIVTPCPACGRQSLFVGTGGHLTCSRLACQNPSVGAAYEEELRAAREKGAVEERHACARIAQHTADVGAAVSDSPITIASGIAHRIRARSKQEDPAIDIDCDHPAWEAGWHVGRKRGKSEGAHDELVACMSLIPKQPRSFLTFGQPMANTWWKVGVSALHDMIRDRLAGTRKYSTCEKCGGPMRGRLGTSVGVGVHFCLPCFERDAPPVEWKQTHQREDEGEISDG